MCNIINADRYSAIHIYIYISIFIHLFNHLNTLTQSHSHWFIHFHQAVIVLLALMLRLVVVVVVEVELFICKEYLFIVFLIFSYLNKNNRPDLLSTFERFVFYIGSLKISHLLKYSLMRHVVLSEKWKLHNGLISK